MKNLVDLLRKKDYAKADPLVRQFSRRHKVLTRTKYLIYALGGTLFTLLLAAACIGAVLLLSEEDDFRLYAPLTTIKVLCGKLHTTAAGWLGLEPSWYLLIITLLVSLFAVSLAFSLLLRRLLPRLFPKEKDPQPFDGSKAALEKLARRMYSISSDDWDILPWNIVFAAMDAVVITGTVIVPVLRDEELTYLLWGCAMFGALAYGICIALNSAYLALSALMCHTGYSYKELRQAKEAVKGFLPPLPKKPEASQRAFSAQDLFPSTKNLPPHYGMTGDFSHDYTLYSNVDFDTSLTYDQRNQVKSDFWNAHPDYEPMGPHGFVDDLA